jgi:hypothetical protein
MVHGRKKYEKTKPYRMSLKGISESRLVVLHGIRLRATIRSLSVQSGQ